MKKLLGLLLIVILISAFAVTSFAVPSLRLEVFVDNSSVLNVTYVATVTNSSSTQPVLVDFYTDKDPGGITPSFPSKYVGSAWTVNGVARISFHQDLGNYLGGAALSTINIRSNIVRYAIQ